MLHWLPSVRCKFLSSRKTFFNHILALVIIAHIVLLAGSYLIGLLSFHYDTYRISMHQSGATYVLMPLDKQVKQQQLIGGDLSGKQSKVIDYESYKKRKKSAKRDTASVTLQQSKSKPTSKKKTQKRSAIALSSKVSKKIKKDKKSKKNKIKMIEQQEIASTIEPEKPAVPANQEQAAVQEQIQQQPAEMSSDDTAQDCLDAIDDNNVIFIGYEQLDQSIIGSKIQQAIVQVWDKPVGIESGTSCDVLVHISDDGVAKTVEMVKSSGIYVYDMQAKQAALDAQYPQEVWNKKITIGF